MGAGVEHVDDVEGQEDMGLVGGVREVAIDKEVKVGDGVEATINANANVNAKLASREEEGSKVRAEVGEEDGGREAAPSSANAKRTEFAGVRGENFPWIRVCPLNVSSGSSNCLTY